MAIPLPTAPDQDDAYFRAILLDLVDRGASLARSLHEHALHEHASRADGDALPDPTIAFDRIARAIRRTIALARHIAAPAPTQASEAAHRRTAARTSLIRGVEDAIHRKAREGADTGRLLAEFTEILEDPALEFDLGARPTAEMVEEICRDLGINTAGRSFVFRRRTPADRQDLRARAAASAAPAAPAAGAIPAAPTAPVLAPAATPRSTSPADSAPRSPRSTVPDAAATHPTGPPRSAPPPAA